MTASVQDSLLAAREDRVGDGHIKSKHRRSARVLVTARRGGGRGRLDLCKSATCWSQHQVTQAQTWRVRHTRVVFGLPTLLGAVWSADGLCIHISARQRACRCTCRALWAYEGLPHHSTRPQSMAARHSVSPASHPWTSPPAPPLPCSHTHSLTFPLEGELTGSCLRCLRSVCCTYGGGIATAFCCRRATAPLRGCGIPAKGAGRPCPRAHGHSNWFHHAQA